MAYKISRSSYADMFGPTVGDKVRLADTELFIEVEEDRTIYGEEVKFGGGKVIRDGMGQSQASREQVAVDTVITNAVILDHWGIVKADVGIKEALRAGDMDMAWTLVSRKVGMRIVAGDLVVKLKKHRL